MLWILIKSPCLEICFHHMLVLEKFAAQSVVEVKMISICKKIISICQKMNEGIVVSNKKEKNHLPMIIKEKKTRITSSH